MQIHAVYVYIQNMYEVSLCVLCFCFRLVYTEVHESVSPVVDFLVFVVVVVGSRCVCRRAGWCDSFAGMC